MSENASGGSHRETRSPSRAGDAAARTSPLSGAPSPASNVAGWRGQRGRGARSNPKNRFEELHYAADEELGCDAGPVEEGGAPRLPTRYLRDSPRTLLTYNESPDVPFDVGLNPYRGCEHGCIYCYARPTHEFLGLSAGLDFESMIFVKEDAPRLLREELSARRWRPQLIGLSGVTDAYQPIERKLGLTRRCLEVLAEFRNPVAVVTKNALVARDADLLAQLASHRAACVKLSITTLDAPLQRSMEPRASSPAKRLEAIEVLAKAGVPVGVMVAPVVPGLTESELPAILAAARDAGASFASTITLRLPHGVKDLFAAWLREHCADRADKVLHRVRELRGGALDDSRFETRMRGTGAWAEQIAQLFRLACRRAGLRDDLPALSAESFRNAGDPQLDLF